MHQISPWYIYYTYYLYINPSFFSMLLCQKQPNNKMTISLILLVIGLCWWFSMTANWFNVFEILLTFFHCILLAKSLAQKKIEILCLLGVKDIYESPFVYVWTLDFHCLLILYLYDFPCFKYSLTMADGHHSNLWNLLLNLLLNWSDYAMLLLQKGQARCV